MDEGNTQILTIKTDVEAGRLLLHWGVEGGKNYKGGWRLPDHNCRPDGTQQYKDRALQTPFRCGCMGLRTGVGLRITPIIYANRAALQVAIAA